ncbi:signal peptidase II [Kangiella sediminilitoris]|uniref:Uncharacterized protein n=1 Tax=Kangiella sediminilitoris TaxID=1144748 RepID=A0A1B3BBF9_9GAMM|nr:signal peptidase II [Kangiella sediminilitoris]AOE50128.1 hypothetical protein KS2013_1416 [Kangiella sediminilitoris]
MINDSTEPMKLEAETVITTFENYGEAWGLYIGLTLLLAGLVWFSFRKQHFLLKWLLTSIVLAGALCFGHPAEDVETYSPLILNTMVELFDGNKEQFFSDIQFIAMIWGILFLFGTAVWLLICYLRKGNKEGAPAKQKENRRVEQKESTQEEPKVSERSSEKKPIEPTIGDDV